MNRNPLLTLTLLILCGLWIYAGCLAVPEEAAGGGPDTAAASKAAPASFSFADRSLGVAGCSNQRETIRAYDQEGGVKTWAFRPFIVGVQNLSGGTLDNWANSGSIHFSNFTDALNQNPQTAGIVWMICVGGKSGPRYDPIPTAADSADALKVLDNFDSVAPGVPVYVAHIHQMLGRTPETECDLTGPAGDEVSANLVGWLVSSGRALPGFDVPGLYPSDTKKGDLCHPDVRQSAVATAQANAVKTWTGE